LQLSPQHDAQSLQQQEAVFCVASVFVAKNKPAAPSISAVAAIRMFFFIVVFLKVLKMILFYTDRASYVFSHPEQRHTPLLSTVRTHHVENRKTTYSRKTWLLR
jgi:hypothetical protein